jgi:uncharacterized protein DUF1844
MNPETASPVSRDDEFSFLFAQMILQQSNMAMMFMGKVAHPESGKVVQDMEAARLFIDQLEMLEAKTRGNLTKEEAALLKQTLMSLRLTFVDAIETPPSGEKDPEPESAPAAPTSEGGATAGTTVPAEEEESRKKFTKKY